MSNASIPVLKIDDTSEYLHCSTKLKFRTVGIRWTIENYDVVCKTVKSLKSPEFPEGEEKSQKWYLEFKPLEKTPYSKEIQEIKLTRTFNGELYVDTLLCLESESTGIMNRPYACLLSRTESIVYRPTVKAIYEKLIWDKTLKKTLIITCTIRIFDSTQATPEYVCGKLSSQLFESNDFLQDMSKFFVDDQTFQDVKITVQDKTFEAHKAVLAARSDVFAAMFTNEMSEKCNSLVEIKDLTPEVIEKMISFIYTDKVDDEYLKEFAPKLLTAAEKYNLQRLKEICIAAMHRNLAVENVLNTLEVADIYSISTLKKEALKFLVSHRQVVICQEEFKTLIAEHPHLMVEFLHIQDNIPETSSDD